MYQSQRKGSALIITLVVLTMVTMMSTVFFERVYRFSQRSEGIENSNAAYYKALGIIEQSLYTSGVNKYTPWNIKNGTTGTKTTTGASISVGTGSSTIPIAGKGNSPYDKNYNIISLSQPVQIVIPNNVNWDNVNFYFRIPQVTPTSSTGVENTSSGYILWTLASSGASLFASGETNIFQGIELDNLARQISTRNGTTNSGSSLNFKPFYDSGFIGTSGADCIGYKCTLKLSLIRPVRTTIDTRDMTFLEYKIVFPITVNIPSQYMDIRAEGYSYGFLRSRDIQFPQITTNTALDFAVLQ